MTKQTNRQKILALFQNYKLLTSQIAKIELGSRTRTIPCAMDRMYREGLLKKVTHGVYALPTEGKKK